MKDSEPKTRKEKADWMQMHVPEALDMMREGVKNGLTFNEPQNLRLIPEPTEPDCYTCKFVQATPGGWYCNKNNFLLDDWLDVAAEKLETCECKFYQEADSDE